MVDGYDKLENWRPDNGTLIHCCVIKKPKTKKERHHGFCTDKNAVEN
jgi:hypothetical protein